MDNPLSWRRAASREIEKLAGLHKRTEDRIAYLRLERDRVVQLGFELRDPALARAVELLDQAILELAAVRRRLEGQE